MDDGMDLLAEQRNERQERILATARALIEKVGYEGVTIRDLARESRVSVPTLYKFFGDKDNLLMQAVGAQFADVMLSIEQTPNLQGLNMILAVLEGCCREVIRTSRYSKAVLAVFVRSGKTSSVMHVVGKDLTESLSGALKEMKSDGELVKWIDCGALAERLSAHQIMVNIEWESGNIPNKALYPTMAYGACLMLMGVSQGKAQKRIAKLLPELQSGTSNKRSRRS
jgi:AcrR family transcriptional regulator